MLIGKLLTSIHLKFDIHSNYSKVIFDDVTMSICDSGRAEDLGELLGSVRRQGVRAEGLLKDADNLIQRYRNLSVRLQEQVEAQNVLQGECDMFHSQAESTRTWITELLKPLSGPDNQSDMIYKAQVNDGEFNSQFKQQFNRCFSLDLRITTQTCLKDLRSRYNNGSPQFLVPLIYLMSYYFVFCSVRFEGMF